MTYDRMGRRARSTAESGAPATAPRGDAAANATRPGSRRRPTDRARRVVRLRLLWSTALVAALVLTLRVESIWQQRGQFPAALSIGTPAEAENPPPAVAPTMQIAAADTPAGAAADDSKLDPFALGKSQIELLQSLSNRRKELDGRERELIQREGLLAAAEHRIEQKIGDLKTIKAEIEALIKKYDEQEEAQLRDLVKIYETMKPKDAARIFNELDMDVLLEVIERMKASKTAPVLASMDAGRAKEVTTRIAERRKMPDIN